MIDFALNVLPYAGDAIGSPLVRTLLFARRMTEDQVRAKLSEFEDEWKMSIRVEDDHVIADCERVVPC